jgi:hypothetical protein
MSKGQALLHNDKISLEIGCLAHQQCEDPRNDFTAPIMMEQHIQWRDVSI